MDKKGEFRKLARIEETGFPFCSLYLNTRWDDEQQRERTRLFTKNELRKASELVKGRETWRKAFEEDQLRIEKFTEGVVRRVHEEGTNGLALFSCGGAGLFFTFPSLIPFENAFSLSPLPALHRLVRLRSQYQNTLVAMVETDSARLLEVSLEGLMGESVIESYVPGRHDQGGPAQMRYQRHIQDHRDKHHKEVADRLIKLFDTGEWKRIVLIGQDRNVTRFRTFLPDRVAEAVVDTFSIDFTEERSRILRRVFERLLQRESEEVDRQFGELADRSPAAGRLALGLRQTLEALNQGQVQTLYLLPSFSSAGGRCTACRTLLAPDEGLRECPVCRQPLQEVPLEEEMVRTVLRHDGEVRWGEANPVLKANQGVGGGLRFR
jgi:peptide chain release factor subunit 1